MGRHITSLMAKMEPIVKVKNFHFEEARIYLIQVNLYCCFRSSVMLVSFGAKDVIREAVINTRIEH